MLFLIVADKSSFDSESMWENLPEILLEDVFQLLSNKDRFRASRVCKRWNDVFYSPRLWHNVSIHQNMFLHTKMHPLHGCIKEISKYQVQNCLHKIGSFIRTLELKPMTDFYRLFEFIFVMNVYIEYYAEEYYPMELLENFKFVFGCESYDYSGSTVIGTGGKLLDEVNRLLGNLQELHYLSLSDLLLETKDAVGFLQDVIKTSSKSLQKLELVNITKERYPIYYTTMFPNLRQLVITPQNLSNDMVLILAQHKNLTELTILQGRHTPLFEPITHQTWLEARQINPNFKVRLEVRGRTRAEIMLQECAPVHCIMYDTPYARVTAEEVIMISELYQRQLKQFGHLQLPRKHGSRSYQERGDTYLVLLIRECPNIETLVIRERVSTATLLIIANEAKKLHNLVVRRQGVLQKFDWPKLSHWSDDQYAWLKMASTSYSRTERVRLAPFFLSLFSSMIAFNT